MKRLDKLIASHKRVGGSRATAFREITDLVAKGVLTPTPNSKGRNARYDLAWQRR